MVAVAWFRVLQEMVAMEMKVKMEVVYRACEIF